MNKLVAFFFIILFALPMLYYVIEDLVTTSRRIHVKDDFYIEYWEGSTSISLHNKNQYFVNDVSEAYWNNDSLVVSGGGKCSLIEFGKTKYNDEMLEISCPYLNTLLVNPPIKAYLK